jgi:hypothetical protein
MRLNTLKTDTEIVRRKTRLARIREKTSGSVNEVLDAHIPDEVKKSLAMARQMARENAFEPSGSPLSY